MIAAALAVTAIAAGGYLVFLAPTPDVGSPRPGEVVSLEPIQVNLAEGSYLRIGIALQLTEEAKEADGSKALDATITTFSGRGIDELSNRKERDRIKGELAAEIEDLYDGEVMDVYFTDFVTQ